MSSQYISDEDILLLAHRYGYISVEHVRRRFFSNTPEWVTKRLKRLYTRGFLTHLTDEINHRVGRDQYIFMLTRDGQVRLGELGVAVPKRVKKTRKPGVRMDHTLGVTHFFVNLERLAAEAPERIAIDAIKHEIDFDCEPEQITLPGGTAGTYKPDGFARVFIDGIEHCLILEYDRGTEKTEREWREKLTGLLAWLNTSYRTDYSAQSAAVAVVAETGQWRADQLLRWTERILEEENLREAGGLFLVSAERPDRTEATTFFTGSHWREPFSRQSYALLELGVPATA